MARDLPPSFGALSFCFPLLAAVPIFAEPVAFSRLEIGQHLLAIPQFLSPADGSLGFSLLIGRAQDFHLLSVERGLFFQWIVRHRIFLLSALSNRNREGACGQEHCSEHSGQKRGPYVSNSFFPSNKRQKRI